MTDGWFSLPSLQESYTYKDPITEFVECLYVNFDFDSAQKKLRECESVSVGHAPLPPLPPPSPPPPVAVVSLIRRLALKLRPVLRKRLQLPLNLFVCYKQLFLVLLVRLCFTDPLYSKAFH